MINTKFNKSDYLLLIIYFAAFMFVELYDHTFHFHQVTYNFIRPDGSSYSQVNTSPTLEGYFAGVPASLISSFSIVLIFFMWLIPNFLIKKENYFIFSMQGILVLAAFGIFRITTWHWAYHIPWETYPPVHDLIIKALNNSASSAGLPLGILLAKKYYETKVELAQTEKKQKEGELKLLQAQLSPHFLFNNLNTLDALISSDPEQAKKYIAHLSALYRYLINTKDQEVVSLNEELSMIKNYFYLIETRFGKVYVFEVKGQLPKADKYLPVGALQVLIENVVKHNRVMAGKSIQTTITIEDEQVTVTNTKDQISESRESFGTGLKNLKERYALLFDKEMKVSDSESKFQVCIPLIELIVS
ncbi:MAG: histidine kinase [Bacteroidota bacterium]